MVGGITRRQNWKGKHDKRIDEIAEKTLKLLQPFAPKGVHLRSGLKSSVLLPATSLSIDALKEPPTFSFP